MRIRAIDTIDWLEHYVLRVTENPIDMHSKQFQQIRDSPLIWNVFEAKFFDKDCCVDDVWKKTELAPRESITNEAFLFFKSRYTEGDNTNDSFESVNLLDRYKEKVQNILCSVSPSIEDKNRVCRMLIYRYRNNLFHGEKELYSLENQIDLFTIMNAYLIDLIDSVMG